MITTLYRESTTVKSWLDDERGKAHREWLREMRAETIMQLKSVRDLIDLGRAQGKLELLDRLLNLREELVKQHALEPTQRN